MAESDTLFYIFCQLTDSVSFLPPWSTLLGDLWYTRGMSNLSIPTVSSGFARLLATENISVRVDSSAPTAAFNVESRELIMPVWENMSEQLTDMLLGHEVSHALHTIDDDLLQTVKT